VKRLALLFLAACNLTPKYERPVAPVPAQFADAGTPKGSASAMPVVNFVQEPKLQKVVALALDQSRDLRKSVLAITAARAQYRIQKAQLYPSIDATLAVQAGRAVYDLGGQTGVATSETYSAEVGVSNWEIDLFGRLRSLTEAQRQQFLATVETAKATRISLVAETAQAWVALAADKSRMGIAKDTMTSAKRTMDLTEALVVGGTENRSDYWQADTLFQAARADVATLQAQIAQDKNALDLLCGAAVPEDLLPDALPDALDWFGDVPAGLESSVLLERPDVLAAEHQLMAANANIGAARAQYFPRITLTGATGIASTALAALFDGPSWVWSLVPSLAQPIFHGGAIKANVEYSKAQKAIMVATYEQAIQSAFRDVADALATRATITEQLDAQKAQVEVATKAFELAQARYKAGVDTFLNSLVAERALYTAKNALAATQQAALANRVQLYRVLGGGTQ
jgi:multidrug efflux system outer membrane protein